MPDTTPHSSHAFHLNTYRVEGATVIECHGKLISDHAPQLRNEVRNLLPVEKRIIIEIDGSQHASSERDAAREIMLIAEGFRTMRYWNNDVQQQPSAVLEDIFAKLGEP